MLIIVMNVDDEKIYISIPERIEFDMINRITSYEKN